MKKYLTAIRAQLRIWSQDLLFALVPSLAVELMRSRRELKVLRSELAAMTKTMLSQREYMLEIARLAMQVRTRVDVLETLPRDVALDKRLALLEMRIQAPIDECMHEGAYVAAMVQARNGGNGVKS